MKSKKQSILVQTRVSSQVANWIEQQANLEELSIAAWLRRLLKQQHDQASK